MTDLKEKLMKKTNKACKPLSSPSHFGNDTLARQSANDRIRRAKQREGPRERVSPVSISITLFISSYRYYAITNTDYIQYYINGMVRLAPHDACSICLVIVYSYQTINKTVYTHSATHHTYLI